MSRIGLFLEYVSVAVIFIFSGEYSCFATDHSDQNLQETEQDDSCDEDYDDYLVLQKWKYQTISDKLTQDTRDVLNAVSDPDKGSDIWRRLDYSRKSKVIIDLAYKIHWSVGDENRYDLRRRYNTLKTMPYGVLEQIYDLLCEFPVVQIIGILNGVDDSRKDDFYDETVKPLIDRAFSGDGSVIQDVADCFDKKITSGRKFKIFMNASALMRSCSYFKKQIHKLNRPRLWFVRYDVTKRFFMSHYDPFASGTQIDNESRPSDCWNYLLSLLSQVASILDE